MLPPLLGVILASHAALGQRMSFRAYAQSDGLTNLAVGCLAQSSAGYLLACTEHGVYAFDGLKFFNLGPTQALPEGGDVSDLALSSAGFLYVIYPRAVYVSTRPLDGDTSPLALTFVAVDGVDGDIGTSLDAIAAPFAGGMLLVRHGQLRYVADPVSGRAPSMVAPPDAIAAFLRTQGAGVHSEATFGSLLLVALTDGRICRLDMASHPCLDPSRGLPSRAWAGFIRDASGRIVTRSDKLLATFEPTMTRATTEAVPTRAGSGPETTRNVTSALSPNGELLMQGGEGLLVRHGDKWHCLSEADGLPAGPLSVIRFDGNRHLWLAIPGQGLVRDLSFGVWENFTRSQGLSNDIIWRLARARDGTVWAATDRGIDRLDGNRAVPVAQSLHGGTTYGLTIEDDDHVWVSDTQRGVDRLTLSTNQSEHVDMPFVGDTLRQRDGSIWFFTDNGVFVHRPGDAPSDLHRIRPIEGRIYAATLARDDTPWMIDKAGILHLLADGTVRRFPVAFDRTFEPSGLAVGEDGRVWISGAGGGGLLHVTLRADGTTAIGRIGPPLILSDTTLFVLVDSRGWVWVGSDRGISVFNGTRWVSATVDSGLVWNDLDQGGVLEGADGSMWFGTSHGLSHLLDPASLFKPVVLSPVITAVTIGGRLYRSRAVPYTTDPLDIQFGAARFGSTMRFIYKLDGVDKGWADTATGEARYPFLPPGQHVFRLVAYDPLTHQRSAELRMRLRMRRPWWEWWPLLVAYVLAAALALYGVMRLRYLYLLRRQRTLQAEVERRTEEIRAAQAALLLQATRDSLTGLLNRGEIQKRLSDALGAHEGLGAVTIGLLDIDHFKRINDRFGHIAGDEILIELGRRLTAELRENEEAGRYGGEEVLIVAHGPQAGLARIRELNDRTCNDAFAVDGSTIPVTCSIGVAQSRPGDDWRSLVRRADRALYLAKAQGRARVIAAEDAA